MFGRPAYQLSRSYLVEGDSFRIRELVQTVLNSAASLYPLPPADLNFSGRKAEIEAARSQWQQWLKQPTSAVKMLTIVGSAGIGKSSLALQLAHLLQSQSTGQIYLDLKGIEAPLSSATILQQVQLALEVSEFANLDRLLLLLNDVQNIQQIQPLLNLIPNCTIIATSRQPLDFESAVTLELSAMSTAEATDLLQKIVGQLEPATAEAIVLACDHSPLAIRLIGGWLAQHPESLDRGLQQLQQERRRCEQAKFSHAAIRACFNLNYRSLKPESAQLLRRLGLLADPSVTLTTAIALTELPLDITQTSLMGLQRAGWLDGDKNRYWLPDCLRLLVKQQLATEETAESRAAARQRWSQAYTKTAAVMKLGLEPKARQQIASRYGNQSSTKFERHLFLSALRWFEAERFNLLATLKALEPSEVGRASLPILQDSIAYLTLRGEESHWQLLQQLLQAIAQLSQTELSQRLAAAQGLNELGQAYLQRQNWERAKQLYEQSLTISHDHDPEQEAQTLANLGLVQLKQADFSNAAAFWEAALALLPNHLSARRELAEWMQSTDTNLFQQVSSQVDDHTSRSWFGAISGLLKRLISDPMPE